MSRSDELELKYTDIPEAIKSLQPFQRHSGACPPSNPIHKAYWVQRRKDHLRAMERLGYPFLCPPHYYGASFPKDWEHESECDNLLKFTFAEDWFGRWHGACGFNFTTGDCYGSGEPVDDEQHFPTREECKVHQVKRLKQMLINHMKRWSKHSTESKQFQYNKMMRHLDNLLKPQQLSLF